MSNKKQFVHSVYLKQGNDNYVIINEKDPETNISNLRILKNVSRSFWVTKEEFRDHEYKKEYEHVDKLDEFTVLEHEKYDAMYEALYNKKPFKQTGSEIYKSPYIYGADIDIQVLVKNAYLKQNPVVPSISLGGLDIETSMITPSQEIILFTYIHEDLRLYTSVYAPFLIKPDNSGGSYTLEDIKKNSEEKITEYLRQYNANNERDKTGLVKVTYDMLNIEYFINSSELDCIKWVFSKIHLCKPDTCSIWSIDFDMPKIIARIEALGGSVGDIICHPEVPKHLRIFRYARDNRNVDHITLKWHNVFAPGYTRYVDGMCLYSRKRTVQGRDVTYKLDYIAEKEVGIGKLNMGVGGGYHQYNQKYNFLNYIAYNNCDCIPMILMEYKNKDLMTLVGSIGNSCIEHYNSQTIVLTNSSSVYFQENKHIACAAGRWMKTKYDKIIPNSGGLVLDPVRIKGIAVAILKGYKTVAGYLKYVLDIDVKSIYPTLTEMMNISKETKISTCLRIFGTSVKHDKIFKNNLFLSDEGIKYFDRAYQIYNAGYDDLSELDENPKTSKKIKDAVLSISKAIIEEYFTAVIFPQQNAVRIGEEFYNLPNYSEMLEIYKTHRGSNGLNQ